MTIDAEIRAAIDLANKMFAEGFKQGLIEGKRQAYAEMKEILNREPRAADPAPAALPELDDGLCPHGGGSPARRRKPTAPYSQRINRERSSERESPTGSHMIAQRASTLTWNPLCNGAMSSLARVRRRITPRRHRRRGSGVLPNARWQPGIRNAESRR